MQAMEYATASGLGCEVVRLHPLRVLVLSPDRCFRASCATLLAHRDCGVVTAASAGEAAELWAAEPIDVLLAERACGPHGLDEVGALIEAGDPHAATDPGALQRRAPAAVVLVCEDPHAGAWPSGGVPQLAKWTPFEEIYAAILRADGRRCLPPAGEAQGWLPARLARVGSGV